MGLDEDVYIEFVYFGSDINKNACVGKPGKSE